MWNSLHRDEGRWAEHAVAERSLQTAIGDTRTGSLSSQHVIVFANEKGGVGKSTLAFHCCVALCEAGHAVTSIDLDLRQQTLSRGLFNRGRTAKTLGVNLPSPRLLVPQEPTGEALVREMERIASGNYFVVIDAAGHDSELARSAIALANTLVTPVNSSFVDLDLLGRFDHPAMRMVETGPFSRLITRLRHERQGATAIPLDWVVVKNRVRSAERRHGSQIDRALGELARVLDFRVGTGLGERLAYRELFPLGLTHLDLRHIPRIGKLQDQTGEELVRLMNDLALPSRSAAVDADAARRTNGSQVARAGGARISEALNTCMHICDQILAPMRKPCL